MISVCLPVYNFNAVNLIQQLKQQLQYISPNAELIVIDDGSCNKSFCNANQQAALPYTYVALSKNIGRSKIRNLFTQYAKNNYLLFLDIDSIIEKNDFLQQYVHLITNQEVDVAYGGRYYPAQCPSLQQKLRWKYGLYKETLSLPQRQQQPHIALLTNNFLVKKTILKQYPFNEELVGYGHEDTLWAFTLQQNNIPVIHINNAVLNNDIETNELFIQKTLEGLQNLKKIITAPNIDNKFIEFVKISSFYNKHQKLLNALAPAFVITNKIAMFLLQKTSSSLTLFTLLKLGYFTVINKQRKQIL